jgi:hypothetical protein
VQKRIASAHANLATAVQVLFGAQEKGLISALQARDDALNVVQRASQTPAAAAVNKLGARLAAGNDRLAQLVRKDQDLAGETETLDEVIIGDVSKEPGQRDATGEQRIRDRLAAIATERLATAGAARGYYHRPRARRGCTQMQQNQQSDTKTHVGFATPPEPPYYAVIFTSQRTEGDRGYESMAQAMLELALKQPGCLGAESVRDSGGLGITVAYFTDESAIHAWKRNRPQCLLRVNLRPKIMSAMTAAFLRSGRRARATAALPTGINRSCCQRGAASLSPHLLAQGIVTRMGRAKDSGRSLEPGPQCGCALDAALNEK